MTTQWWSGLPAAQTVIDCGGHSHRLRWEAGRLTAVDHGDPEDEATLAALAGERVRCLDMLRAWNRRRTDPRVLVLGSRGGGDRIHSDGSPPGTARLVPAGPGRPALPRPGLPALLALGGGLPERLQAEAAATWTRRLRTGHRALADTQPQLYAALYGRLLATLRAWLDEPELDIELEMVDADAPRTLARAADGVVVALPFGWLSEVWARDMSVAFGRLCLAARIAETADGSQWTLDTLEADLATTREMRVRL